MQNSLRIVFVTNNYTPYSGGVVSSINAFTDELRARGHRVTIITLDFLGSLHNDPSFVIRLPCPIKFLYKNNHMAFPLRAMDYMRHHIANLRPDIIHSHHPFLLGGVALKIAREQSIPFIFTHHSLYSEWAHAIPIPSFITQPLIKNHVTRYCKSVDGIIAPCRYVRDSLVRQGISRPIIVIPSPLQHLFLPSNSFSPKKGRRPYDPFHLVSVTRCSKEKNPFFLLDLIALLVGIDNRFRMTIVGYGPLWKKMYNYAYEKLHLKSDIITFIYRPPKEQIARVYRDADLFVFSSQTDTQGLVIAEAMAAGTPIVALTGPGQRDSIHDGHNGFIVNNAQQMIKKILFLANNPRLHKKIQEKAWKISKQHNPQFLTDCLVRAYGNILNKYSEGC